MSYLDKIFFMICPLCSRTNVRLLRIEKGVKIFECLDCQLGFIDQNNISTNLQRSMRDSEFYNFKEYQKEELKLRKRFEKLAKLITNYKQEGNILEVGAGFGLFASILVTNSKYKIDLIDSLAMYRYIDTTIHNIKPFRGSFENYVTTYGKKHKKYDMVIMMDVIEHFKDPLSNLKKAKSLLKNDGILVIQTPNYKSLMARICKNWAWWMIEDHKFFFSPKSLKLMLNRAGFQAKYLMSYEDFSDFKKNLDGNFTNIVNSLSRKIIKASFFLIFIPFYFITRKLIWKRGFGGLIFTIVYKSQHT